MVEKKIVLTSGKRKTAIARATIKPGKGTYRINGVPVESIANRWLRLRMLEPFKLIGDQIRTQLDVKVRVQGGGSTGQSEAVRIAVARGIDEFMNDPQIRAIFTAFDKTMLSGDPRRRESKKFGGRGARARYQKSYR